MEKRKLILTIVTICSSLFSVSCHSEYISLGYKIVHGAMWNNDHSRIAFFLSKKAYRAPKGIARFPDGGISKIIFSEVGLFVFDPQTKHLYEALTFESFPSARSIKIAYTDDRIYYHFIIDWEYRLQFAKTEADSQKVYQLKKKYDKPFVFNTKTREVTNVDNSTFLKVYKKDNKVDYMTLHNQIAQVPLSQLGLVLNEIHPKSDKDYIKDFIYSSKGGNRLTRRAIAEQIISKLSKEEIRDILKRIDDHKNSLDGLERKRFEIYSKDKYNLVNKLL